MTDSELVAGVISGQVDYRAVVEQYQPLVNSWLNRWLRNPADAEELTQCVFIRAYNRLARYDPKRAALRTWLHKLAWSCARSFWFHNRHRMESTDALLECEEPTGPGPEELVAEEEKKFHLWRLMSELPAAERVALHDHFWLDKTWDEVGRELGTSGRQARNYRKQAVEKMRSRW